MPDKLLIAGVDEAGRGPLAGPVVAAAVILPDQPLDYYQDLKDSKKLSPKKREYLFDKIVSSCARYSIVAVGHHRIDKLNIRGATKLAMELAVKKVKPHMALIDGDMKISIDCEQKTIIKGDALIPLISAASILAKVYRDRIMKILHLKYPQYGFLYHQGYPTKAHRLAILNQGPCKVHRRSFSLIKNEQPNISLNL